MEMMEVGRIHGPGNVRVSSEPKPEVGEGESLVRVTAVGLCGSDLHWFHSGGIGDAVLESPLVLGHEFGGVVEGGELDGQTVAVDPARPCLNCVDCDEGNRNLCVNVQFAGHGTNDGGLREYVAWPTDLLYPVPKPLTGIDAALLEPLGVALHAWDLAKVRLGSRVLVVGTGPIGAFLVRLAKTSGVADVVAVDPLEHRRDAATDSGADLVINPNGDSGDQELKNAAEQYQFDVVFEAANHGSSADTAVNMVKVGGKVILVGIPDDDVTTFRASTARRKGLTIKISRRMGEVYPRAIELVEKGLIDLQGLATHVYGFDEIATAFQQAQNREGMKIIIQPSSQS